MGIFKFTKKKESVVQSYNTETVDGAEVWMVSWYARTGPFYNDRTIVAKAFLSEEDANNFKKSLEAAQDLLQNKENIEITIVKQV